MQEIKILLKDVNGALDIEFAGTQNEYKILEILQRAVFAVSYSIGEEHGRKNVCEND